MDNLSLDPRDSKAPTDILSSTKRKSIDLDEIDPSKKAKINELSIDNNLTDNGIIEIIDSDDNDTVIVDDGIMVISDDDYDVTKVKKTAFEVSQEALRIITGQKSTTKNKYENMDGNCIVLIDSDDDEPEYQDNKQEGILSFLNLNEKKEIMLRRDASAMIANPQKCEFCEKYFIKKKKLLWHQLEHANLGIPFKCDVCLQAFFVQAQFDHHKLTHFGEQKCVICSNIFKTVYSYKDHMRLHTGEVPYVCTICNHGFFGHPAFRKHVLECHSETET